MNFYDTVRYLADFVAEPDSLVLSLYLDISHGKETQALRFAKEECAMLLEGNDEDQNFAILQARVNEIFTSLETNIRNARKEDYDGLAIFICETPKLYKNLFLRFPFQNQAQLGKDPFLRQLLFYAEEYEQSVCVIIGPEKISLCEVHVGDISRTREVIPTHGRSRGEELDILLRKLIQEDPRLHVILLGEPLTRQKIASCFSKIVQERILDRIDSILDPEDPHFLPAIHKILQAYERRTEAKGVAKLLQSETEKSHLIAANLEDTLQAINQGTIQTLYVLQNFSKEGWLCDACFYLGVSPAPPVCLACGASVSHVPLEEHILDQVAACGAEIETVFSSEELARLGGIGALLHEKTHLQKNPKTN